MDGPVTRTCCVRGGSTRGVGAGAGHLPVEAPVPPRRLPRLRQHASAGGVLSWAFRSGTRLQPERDSYGAAVDRPPGPRLHFEPEETKCVVILNGEV